MWAGLGRKLHPNFPPTSPQLHKLSQVIQTSKTVCNIYVSSQNDLGPRPERPKRFIMFKVPLKSAWPPRPERPKRFVRFTFTIAIKAWPAGNSRYQQVSGGTCLCLLVPAGFLQYQQEQAGTNRADASKHQQVAAGSCWYLLVLAGTSWFLMVPAGASKY